MAYSSFRVGQEKLIIMTVFESSPKTIKAGRLPVHRYLSDIRNLQTLVPEDTVRNLVFRGDYFRFTIDGFGEVGVRKVPVSSEEKIRFESDGSRPFRFDLEIELGEMPGGNTEIRLVLSAELSMMMKMMAKKPLQEGVEMAASVLSDELNNKELT